MGKDNKKKGKKSNRITLILGKKSDRTAMAKYALSETTP
jgi:hypothetical protein